MKYCIAAPNDSGGSRRTSTCMPLRCRKLTLFSPCAMMSINPGEADQMIDERLPRFCFNAVFACHENVEVADGLTSARSDPAGVTFSMPGTANKCSVSFSASCSAVSSRKRPPMRR